MRILARKGGTGKTTLAVHLAVMAAEGRRVLLLDTDPQRSAGDWWRVRKADVPQLVEADARRVPAVLQAAERDGADLVVIDTRPSVEADTAEIARLADLVLFFVGPQEGALGRVDDPGQPLTFRVDEFTEFTKIAKVIAGDFVTELNADGTPDIEGGQVTFARLT